MTTALWGRKYTATRCLASKVYSFLFYSSQVLDEIKLTCLRLTLIEDKLSGEDIGVGAQSTLGGHKIFARKICIKISKVPEFYMIRARKIIEIPEFLYLPENLQNPRILHDFCPKKYFFPNFRGARAHPPPSPVSYAYGWRASTKYESATADEW